MTCIYCDIVTGTEKAVVLYEDDQILVAIKDKVATPGQITVFSREHYPILEMVPDGIVQRAGVLANKISIAVFESLGSKGTNIIVQNGLSAGQIVPHFGIEVIPRQEGDALNLQWQPKQLMEDEIETVFLMLSEEMAKLVELGKKSFPEEKPAAKPHKASEKVKKEKDNYLLKSVRRIP